MKQQQPKPKVKEKNILHLSLSDRELEYRVLSELMQSGGKYYSLTDRGMFFYTSSQITYDAISLLQKEKIQISYYTVVALLQQQQLYDESEYVHIRAFNPVMDLAYSESMLANIKQLDEVRKKRATIQSLEVLRNEITQLTLPQVHAGLRDIQQKIAGHSQSKYIHECEIDLSKHEIIKTNSSIDTLCYLSPGDLFIVAGRTSTGKTALMMSLARWMQKYNPLYISAEMSEKPIVLRMHAMEKKKEIKELYQNPLILKEKIKSKILVDFPHGCDTSEISMKVVEHVLRYNTRVVFIDHIGRLSAQFQRNEQNNAYQRMTRVIEHIKNIAMGNDVLIFAGVQVSRDKQSPNRKITKEDLRDSGRIEEEADVICLINLNEKKDGYVLNIEKNRNGQTGDVESLQLNKRFIRWEESIPF